MKDELVLYGPHSFRDLRKYFETPVRTWLVVKIINANNGDVSQDGWPESIKELYFERCENVLNWNALEKIEKLSFIECRGMVNFRYPTALEQLTIKGNKTDGYEESRSNMIRTIPKTVTTLVLMNINIRSLNLKAFHNLIEFECRWEVENDVRGDLNIDGLFLPDSLTTLRFSGYNLETPFGVQDYIFPEHIKYLELSDMSLNHISSTRSSISKMKFPEELIELDLSNNVQIERIPSLSKMAMLEVLNVCECTKLVLNKLPMTKLKSLNVRGVASIRYEKIPQTVEKMDVSGIECSESKFKRFIKLKALKLENTYGVFTRNVGLLEFPDGLEELSLANSNLVSIDGCTLPDSLTHFNLSGNKISSLTSNLPPRLKVLNLSNNQLETLPSLPVSLERLVLSGFNGEMVILPANIKSLNLACCRSLDIHNVQFPETMTALNVSGITNALVNFQVPKNVRVLTIDAELINEVVFPEHMTYLDVPDGSELTVANVAKFPLELTRLEVPKMILTEDVALALTTRCVAIATVNCNRGIPKSSIRSLDGYLNVPHRIRLDLVSFAAFNSVMDRRDEAEPENKRAFLPKALVVVIFDLVNQNV